MADITGNIDIIVVGGGYAGIEASLAAARMGTRVLLITMSKAAIGRMSCNPAIGGTAKGHLVREIDALGGEMGKIADTTGIQFRLLNKSKGPAVWSPLCQSDREWYSKEARRRVESQDGISIFEDTLLSVHTESHAPGGRPRVCGVTTSGGRQIRCKAVVLDQSTRSRAGAVGVMQLLPSTAADPSVGIPDITKLDNNIHAGTKYLDILRDRYLADLARDPINQTLFTFAAYNAGPSRIRQLREEAARTGLDPDVWFGSVENVGAKRIGRQTVQYVSNIAKYYVAYKLASRHLEIRDGVRSEGPPS